MKSTKRLAVHCAVLCFMLVVPGWVHAYKATPSSPPMSVEKTIAYIQKNAPSEEAFLAVQRLAVPWILSQQWAKAAAVYERFQPDFPKMAERFDAVIRALQAKGDRALVTNLGDKINTPEDEWDPTPTMDGKHLYFTAKRKAIRTKRSSVFMSSFKDDAWQAGTRLKARITSAGTLVTMNTISVDNNRLLLSGTIADGFQMYYMDRVKGGWAMPVLFPRPVNSPFYDDGPQITSDSKVILFTSDRPGGIGTYHPHGTKWHGGHWGNTDIYASINTGKGWDEPVNLGNVINTPYAETGFYLHPDNRTLYFSSDGHGGFGGLDIFVSKRLREDSWTEWSKPKNLGKAINTGSDEWGYKVTLDGRMAYFASQGRADSHGGWDLYSVLMPGVIGPDDMAIVRGRVIDPAGNPLGAVIKWEDLADGKTVGSLTSNPDTGNYFITLHPGKFYGYYAELEGYFPVSNSADLRKTKKGTVITRDIILVPIDLLRGAATPLNNVFFDFNKATLRTESRAELKRFARLIKQYPTLHFFIAGHADSIGTKAYNLKLSKKRAWSVINYLVKLGCKKSRFTAKGYGEEMPVADNASRAGRQKNRRVEFWVQ